MSNLAEELNERSKHDDEIIVGSEIRAALQEQRLEIERLEKALEGMTELRQATTEQKDAATEKVRELDSLFRRAKEANKDMRESCDDYDERLVELESNNKILRAEVKVLEEARALHKDGRSLAALDLLKKNSQ